MSRQLDPKTIKGPVLVIAPHPDDETLGCGGLIAALVQSGTRVHTLFVTDGSSSHRNSKSWPAPRIALQRQQEAANALALLGAGLEPRTFLALTDANMPAPGLVEYEGAMTDVLAILRTLNPSLVIAPWRRDPHCDHRDAWSLITDALRRAGQTPDVLEYTIWLDEFGVPEDFPAPEEVEIVEFSAPDLVALKRKAITAHASQLGGLILDDPTGFYLTADTLDRLIRPTETYWRL